MIFLLTRFVDIGHGGAVVKSTYYIASFLFPSPTANDAEIPDEAAEAEPVPEELTPPPHTIDLTGADEVESVAAFDFNGLSLGIDTTSSTSASSSTSTSSVVGSSVFHRFPISRRFNARGEIVDTTYGDILSVPRGGFRDRLDKWTGTEGLLKLYLAKFDSEARKSIKEVLNGTRDGDLEGLILRLAGLGVPSDESETMLILLKTERIIKRLYSLQPPLNRGH